MAALLYVDCFQVRPAFRITCTPESHYSAFFFVEMHQASALRADRPVFYNASPAFRGELFSAHNTQVTLLACPDSSISVQGFGIAKGALYGVAGVIA
jgi:hypothetical protein